MEQQRTGLALSITVLNSTNAFNIHMVDASVNGTDYALTNRLSSLLIIPSGFNASANMAFFTQGAATANVTFVYDQSTSSAPARSEHRVEHR